MIKSSGKCVISFGLVNVPMKLFVAADNSTRIAFNLLSPAGTRLKQLYIDSSNGNVVEHADQHRGYEFARGQYVVFTQEELKAFNEPSTPNATIEEFVPESAIDSTMVEKTYYLSPDKGGEKGYELLRQVLLSHRRVGVTKHCTHGKQHLAILRATDEGLLFQHVYYTDERRKISDVYVKPQVKLSSVEIKMAEQLVNMLTNESFDASKFRDDVKDRLAAAIEAKIEGKEIQVPEVEDARPATLDLMAQLKKTLEKAV